jgi:hypothetical protein
MVPHVSETGHWVLYAMDISEKRVHVLDLISCTNGAVTLEEKHSFCAKKLVQGLAECAEHFYEGWEVNPGDWDYMYHAKLDEDLER